MAREGYTDPVRTGIFFAVLVIMALALVVPAAATDYILNPGDSIQNTIYYSVSDYDTIILNPGVYYPDYDFGIDVVGTNHITIRAADGHGAWDTFIDAKSSGRIFGITGVTFTIENLTLQNGKYLGNGGAIYSYSSTVLITNSTITNCEATPTTDGGGGAIYSSGGSTITLINSAIANCTSTTSTSYTGGGGAIYSDSGTITLTSSAITNCSETKRYGGAIYGNATITASTIANCSATKGYGGAIYGNATIVNTNISNCRALSGGAIYSASYASGSPITLSNSAIINCSATKGYGGAIYGNTTVTATTIANCSATYSGYSGGAIYSNQGTVLITNSAITNCSAARFGGAISSRDSTITATTITNCSATSATSYGGAIYASGTATITSSAVNNCTANSGGGISISGGTVTATTIADCIATYGGGISISGGTVTTTTITNCSARLGGAIYSTSTNVIATIISNCSATGNGGAIYAGDYTNDGVSTTTTVSSTTISNCSATNYGGAVYTSDSSVITTITSTTISSCSAQYGGAISIPNPVISSTTITNCSASMHGGAIYQTGSPSTGTITTTSITNCSAGQDGGAIFVWGNNTITFSRIYGNTAQIGPTIYLFAGTPEFRVNATYNWWGQNDGPLGDAPYGGTSTYAPWLRLGTIASPSSIAAGRTSEILANLTYDSDGTYHDPAGFPVPDGIPVTFTLHSGTGTLLPLSGNMISGVNATTLSLPDIGISTVRVMVDNQSVDALIYVESAPPPEIISISPVTGVNTGTTQVTITGMNFNTVPPPTVNLTRSGYANITLTGTRVSSGSLDITIPANEIAGIWNVNVVNPDGREGTNPLVTFTVIDGSLPTPSPAPSTVTGSTASSDSGSSSDSPLSTSISSKPGTKAVTAVNAGDVSAGSTVILNFYQVPASSTDPPTVDQVTLTTTDSLKSLEMTAVPVSQYTSSSTFSGKAVAGYLSVTPVGVNDASISGGTIRIAVNSAWLEDRDLQISDVSLMLHHDGTWNTLPTTYHGQIGTEYYFTATTPGFSTFAVVAGNGQAS